MLKKYIIITSVIFSCLFGLNPSYAQSPIVDVNFKVNDIYEDEESVIIQAIVYNLGNTNINGFNDIDVVLKSMNDELIAQGTFEIDDLKAISFEPGESFFFTGAMNKTAPVTYPYKYVAESSVNWNNITELSDDIKLYINSEQIVLEQNPVIINNRMLVPISTIASNFDYEVNWNQSDKTVTLTSGPKSVKLTINSTLASVDSENVSIDTAPIILNNRTMVPISFIVDAFGADYSWGAQTKILSIYY